MFNCGTSNPDIRKITLEQNTGRSPGAQTCEAIQCKILLEGRKSRTPNILKMSYKQQQQQYGNTIQIHFIASLLKLQLTEHKHGPILISKA